MITLLAAVVAIVGGTVHPVEGEVIEGGTVIITDGRITAVGAGLVAPAGATVIDARGKVVTPGLFHADTALGLVEIWGAEETVDLDGGGDPIRAAFRAVDAFNPQSTVIPVQRAHGITAALVAPGGGLIAGQAAVMPLWGEGPIAAPAAMVAGLGGGAPGSRGMALLRLREALDDARVYDKNRAAFERRALRDLAASRLDLEALVPVVRGELPLMVRVDRESEIAAVLRLAEAQKIRVIISGGAEAWRLAGPLAAAKVPVIIDPVLNAPESFDQLRTRADAAALLVAAGVPVALSTFGLHEARKLRQWAGNAVRAGLPHPAALRAVTRAPALMFGLTDRGALTVGARGDVVVWSGDPFETRTRAEHVFVGGEPAPLDHRQRALLDRYRDLPPLPPETAAPAAK
ncbi:MAG: amidohydrolase family protein [Myxococcales bacterium]|nr:amidohydrolase family protein [Myxococcales bacterium]